MRATLVVHLPGAGDELQREIAQIVALLARGHPLIERLEAFGETELRGMSGAQLKERLGEGHEEFYYAHDAVGTICRRLAAAYPSARKVCNGDAFGMVYTAESLPAPSARARLGALARRLAATLAGKAPLAPVRPDVAALVLPVDVSGNGLRDVSLVCCRKDDFLAAIDFCHANAAELRAHMHDLMKRHQGRHRYLLLTENYAEAGHASLDNEVAMYCEVIRRHCARAGVVLVKTHPLEAAGKDVLIARRLAGEYEVVGVDRRFARYPIELWREAVLGASVICTAYPVLSLKYAYGIDVVQPMNDELIDRWLEPAYRQWSRAGLRLYAGPLARLPRWDGQSVLWSGGNRA